MCNFKLWRVRVNTVAMTTRRYTGRFIMYSGITKIYYRKTVGHVFTKPVQIEGITQIFIETRRLCKQKSSGRPLTAEDDGPVFCIVRRNERELQLRSYRC